MEMYLINCSPKFNIVAHYYDKNLKWIFVYFPKERFYIIIFYAITPILSGHKNPDK